MRARTGLAVVLLIASAVAGGCSTRRAESGGSNRNVLTGEQLADTNARMVYEAIERLRPAWLNSRGPISMADPTEARANVYINGSPTGDLDYLRQVYVIDVEEIRFYAPGEAGARFGMGNPRGVIAITTRR